MRRVAAALGAVAVALAIGAVPAAAHGIGGGKTILPFPAWVLGWAAAIVLVVSFVALSTLWPQPRLERASGRALVRIPVAIDVVAGVLGVLAFAGLVYAGLSGTQVPQANILPTVVFVHFWVGFVVLSLLFGNVWAAVSPWRAVARGVTWVARRVRPGADPAPLAWPERLGRWPAATVVVGFAWLELAYLNRDDPRTLAILALAYAAVQLVGMSLFGIETWTQRADGFGVLYGLLGRLAPLHRRRDRMLELRPPLSGAPHLDLVPGTVAVLVAMIGSTTFDGLSAGPVWQSAEVHLTNSFHGLGLGYTPAAEISSSIGLAGCIALVALFYRAGARGVASVDGERSPAELSRRFVHSLIPIAAAYAIAHYFSFLVFNGQDIIHLASDPLGNGANYLGTDDFQVDYALLGATSIYIIQVVALLAGHVGGLVLAHDRALVTYSDVRRATRSQYWMLVVMVGFTSLGLWLLSAVNA